MTTLFDVSKLSVRKNKPKMVIIGLGSQGIKHARAAVELHKASKIELTATCDPESTGLLGIQHFGSIDSLFQSVDFDTAIVAVPNYLHFSVCKQLLICGITVLKEKPFACSLDEADQILALVDPGQLHIMQQRFYKKSWQDFELALPLVGEVTSFWYQFSLLDSQLSWYWDLEKAGGGVWLNMGWHVLTMIRSFLGDIDQISLTCNRGGMQPWLYQTEHTAFGSISLQSGVQGRVLVSSVHDPVEVFRITGSLATLELKNDQVFIYQGDGKELVSLEQSKSTNYSSSEKNGFSRNPYINQLQSLLSVPKHSTAFDRQTLKDLLSASEHDQFSTFTHRNTLRKDTATCLI